jgi:glycosyltransferase involved in cell wall biosynthesis
MVNSGPITPIVSVVMPLYNKEKDVSRAIDSVLSQTAKEFELIAVNDGSTDKGPEVVRAFKDQRIRIIDQPNQGVSAARNKGIAEAKADLIAFLDADDEWKPDFLEIILRLKRKFPTCSVFATNYFFSLPDGSNRPTLLRELPRDFHEAILPDYFAIASRSDPPLCSSAVAVTKTAITSTGGFPAGITSGEDLLTWARLAARFQIGYSTKPCSIHYNPQTVSDRPGRMPQEPDKVGDSLRDLLNNADSATIPGLKAYIALWHRMRAVIFIQLGDKKNARKEVRVAMRFAPSLRLSLLLFIAILPASLAAKALMYIKRMRATS